MNIFAHFRNDIINILKKLPSLKEYSLQDQEYAKVKVEPSLNFYHGDITTNAALALAQRTHLSPATLASSLAEALCCHPSVAACQVAAPGFINLTLSEDFWVSTLRANLLAGQDYGLALEVPTEQVTIIFPEMPSSSLIPLVWYRATAQGEALARLLTLIGHQTHVETYTVTASKPPYIHVLFPHKEVRLKVTNLQSTLPVQIPPHLREKRALGFALMADASCNTATIWEASLQNPLFSVLYAYARLCSVKRYIAHCFPSLGLSPAELSAYPLCFEQEAARNLLKRLALWPYYVERSAITLEPQRLAVYLDEIAKAFHHLWPESKGGELRFVYPSDPEVTGASAALLQGTVNTIAAGLQIFNVMPFEEL